MYFGVLVSDEYVSVKRRFVPKMFSVFNNRKKFKARMQNYVLTDSLLNDFDCFKVYVRIKA